MKKKTFSCIAIIFLLLSSAVIAQTTLKPSFGDGTIGNPYRVTTWENLQWITATGTLDGFTEQQRRSSYYLQVRDISFPADVNTWDGGKGWTPIYSFNGVYDGGWHTISGLYINRPDDIYQALFARLETNARLKNLGVIDGSVVGKSYVGGLFSYVWDSDVIIENCYSSVIVTGKDTVYSTIGGFGGFANGGVIKNCYSTGNVISYGKCAGGFIGSIQGTATIQDCFSRGNVTRSAGTETMSYAGFIGWFPRGTISNSYSTGAVIYQGATNPTDRGFAGYVGASYTMTNCFWDSQTSGQATTYGTATAKTTANMKTNTTFTGASWNFTDIWAIDAGKNDGYPYLQWQDTYSIAYNNVEGATHYNPVKFNATSLPLTLLEATKTGCAFVAWYDNASFTGDSITQISTIGNKALYAKFDTINYDITYNTNGGTHLNPATFNIGDLPLTLLEATKTDYAFIAWYDNAIYTGDSITQISTIGNKTLYAKFISIASVNDAENDRSKIFPNPTKGIVNIELSGNIIQKLTISDITGKQLVLKTDLSECETIDLFNFDNGVYIITIQTDKQVITKKIIKE